ncbi:MAG: TonB family protein [Betaproteobacteria bacterium]|nr:TonB family protein [Betaproteobacteria bacterium]
MGRGKSRIGEALALSALAHVLVLAPLFPRGVARPLESRLPALVVNLEAPAAERGGSDSGPAAGTAAVPARAFEPAEGARFAQSEPPRAQAFPSALPARDKNATRAARPGEVSVRVLMMASGAPGNPDEYAEANGRRYVYFNSPTLDAPARPLNEPRPRYPRSKVARPDGAVLLQFLISETGALEDVAVVCAAPAFERSARESVRGLSFSPARGKTGPVRSYMLVEFGYGRGFPCSRVPD